MPIKDLFKRKTALKEPIRETMPKNEYVNWSYRSIPITLELSRRRDEEELFELYHVQKPKRAVIIHRGERNV